MIEYHNNYHILVNTHRKIENSSLNHKWTNIEFERGLSGLHSKLHAHRFTDLNMNLETRNISGYFIVKAE